MAFPGEGPPAPDFLTGGGDRPRARRAVLIVAAASVVALGSGLAALLALDGSEGSRKTAATATPTSPSRDPDSVAGPVFLEHLPKCTRTDHHHVLTLAFGVSNLGRASLVLLGASPILDGDDVLRLARVRLGAHMCAARAGRQPVRLAPADEAVVAMTFHIGARCPHESLVAARVTFDAGPAGVVHSDSSALTDLSRLGFAQC